MPLVSISSASASEGEALSFVVTLSEAAVDAVTLTYRPLLGTAEENDLYYDPTSSRNWDTLVFAPGETSKTVSIWSRRENEDERDESVQLQLSGLSANASFAGGEDVLSATGVILDDDGSGSNLALLVSDVALVEGDAGAKQALFELRLSRPAEQSFTVSYRTRDISAVAGSDYTAVNGSVTFAVGDEVKTVSVPVRGDTLAEATESFALVVTPPAGIGLGTEGLAGEALIRDDDTAPQPSVSVTGVEALEGSALIYSVTLSEPTFDAVTLTYRALLGTAADRDLYYDLTSSRNWDTLTFAPGETVKTVTIWTRSESEDERDESVQLQLSGLSANASFAGGEDALSATGVILDDDGTGANLALLVSDVALLEGNAGAKQAVFELRLSRPAEQSFTVSYRTRDISAVAGQDYAERIGSLSFAAGEQVKTVSVPVLGDTLAEATESFALVVTPPAGIGLGTEGLAGEALIRDDDTAPQPSVSVTGVQNFEGEALIYSVALSAPSEDEVSMVYRADKGSSEDADFYYDLTSSRNWDTLTFAPGETVKTVTIWTRSESEDERDESMMLHLSNLSANASFAGGEDVLSATGVILDDDGTGANLALFATGGTLLEGDAGAKQAVFELRLSRPAETALQVGYQTVDITARAGEDYQARNGTVSFAPGEQVKTVSVPVLGDTASEFSERFGLRVDGSAVPGLTVVDSATEMLIRDDDTVPEPVITVQSASAPEGKALLYTVSLSRPSVDEVSVEFSTLEGTAEEGDLYYGLTSTRNADTLVFEPGQTSRTVAIWTRGDSTDERDETVVFRLSNAVGASFADGAPSVQTLGTILDDDGVGLNRIASVAPVILREQAVASFIYEIPVELSEPASAPLAFSVRAIDQTALAGRDYRLLDSRVNFAAGQSVATVSVQVIGDSQVEQTEAFTLSLDPVAGTPYTGGVADQVIYIRPGPLLPSAAADVLRGTVGPDSINLLAGDDRYEGLEGNDTVYGGVGDDTVIGGAGADVMDGQAGNDLLIGGEVADVSDEIGAQVYRLYQATLGRVPDTVGFDSWGARLGDGDSTLGQAISGFVQSAEFQKTYGALDNRGFVTLLYQNVLERAPSAVEVNGWLAQLTSGTSREQVVQGFSQSAEFIKKTNAEAYAFVEGGAAAPWADDVYQLYQATLGRAPDFAGLEGWASRLGDGTDFLSVVTGFVNSQEFQNTYGAVGNPGFVTLLYQNVLGRAPDKAGLDGWLAQLAGGSSREQVVQGFSQSAEFIKNTAPAFHRYMAAQEGDRFDGGPGDDVLYGGLRADEFVFDLADKGRDRVLQFDAWDSVEFNGFGYTKAAQAVAHMQEVGPDVVFADQGVVVTFMRADLDLFTGETVLV